MNIHEADTGNSIEAEATDSLLELISLDGEITLRQYSLADAPAAFALIDRNRKHLSRFGDTTARKYKTLESFQKSIEHPANPDRLRMGIWNSDGELVGTINLTPQAEDLQTGEVRYYLGEEFQGHGYATIAVETITDYAFQQGGFHTLFGDVHKKNEGSEAVLQAAGYVDHDWSDGQNKYYAYADHIAIRRKPGTTIADGVNTKPYRWDRIIRGEVSDLAKETIEIIGENAFLNILEISQRFKIEGRISNWQEASGWYLGWVLEQIPTYVDAAHNAGLIEDQMQDLLFTVIGASPYDHHNNNSELIVLARALNEITEKGVSLSELDIRRIKTMIKLGGSDGIISSYLSAFEHATRIGLSVKDSTRVISHFSIDDVWVHPGYAIAPFREALRSLKTTGIDPEAAKFIFTDIEKLPRHVHGDAYTLLEHAVTFTCLRKRVTPQELIEAYRAYGDAGTIIDFLERFIADDDNNLLGEQAPEVIDPVEMRDKYFLPKDGLLEHSATPYQVKRSLEEGIQDLRELADARFYRFEEVAEGFWVFDPNSSTWYSFGGKTEIKEHAIRHEFLPYDISELTDQPYLFHVHNAEFDSFLTNPYSEFPPRQFRDQARKFLMATPSRADYSVVADLMRKAKNNLQFPRSFIAHTSGITEFEYPADLDSLEYMVGNSRDIRDQAMLDFDWHSLYFEDETTGVSMLVDALNKILPPGFSNKLNAPVDS
jgi:RimJ/RimL family protein N-acetyltransferase